MPEVRIHQQAIGNTGQRATSSSSSPATSSVRNQSSQVVVGNPGQQGQPTTNTVTTQATPRPNPILYATGQGPNQPGSIPRPDMSQIQSYTDQLRSGTINAQQFADQLRNYLSEYRNQLQPTIQNRINQARTSATQAGRAASSSALSSARSLLSQARQTVNSTAASLPAGSVPSGVDAALSDAERWLIERESGGDVNAYNPVQTDSGNAFGLGQLTTANRQRIGNALGINPDTTDYNEQLAMMRYYINERYGSPEAAMAFWQQNGWY